MSSVAFPLKTVPTKRFLVDQKNVPFLLQGDAAWSLLVVQTKEEVELYFKNRSQKGFNTCLVNVLEHWFCNNPPFNAYGEAPFTSPDNFSTPNEKYFLHVDWVINKAAEFNIQLLLAPMYLGSVGHDEGWIDVLLAQKLENCLEYGRYLGKRYGQFSNILWSIGADRNPTPQTLERLNLIALGIKEYDKRHLMTGQCAPEASVVDEFSSGGWLDFNACYTYSIVHRKLLVEYNREPMMPFFLIESSYENEHNSSQAQIRRQAYWAVLCGGFGHIFGNYPVDVSRAGWQTSMDLPGSISMFHWGNLFRSRPWYDLIPDQKHEVVTGGLGEFRGLDYLSAAYSADGKLLVVYMSTPRSITVDLSKMNGKMKGWWFDPRTGKSTEIDEFPTKGSKELTPPGDGDWVLVLDDASKGLSPPGQQSWN